MWDARALTVASVVLMVGCASPAQRGSTLYQQERFVEAEELFVHTEDGLRSSQPRERAEYALYRGLTLLELGDATGAHRWLELASQVEHTHPRSLSSRERKMLGEGFARLRRDAAPAASTVAVREQPVASEPAPAAPTAAAAPSNARRSLR